MVDPTTLPITVARVVTSEAPQFDLLLYDWLSELIYLKDLSAVVDVLHRLDLCRRVATPSPIGNVKGGGRRGVAAPAG